MSAFRRTVSPASTMPLADPEAPSPQEAAAGRQPNQAGAALATATIAAGGTAAAYAGVLPAPVKDFAHRLIDAPPAHHGPMHRP